MSESNNKSRRQTTISLRRHERERERERERGGGGEGLRNEIDRRIVFIGMLLWLSLKNKRKREI